jgi:hypothetical protein
MVFFTSVCKCRLSFHFCFVVLFPKRLESS